MLFKNWGDIFFPCLPLTSSGASSSLPKFKRHVSMHSAKADDGWKCRNAVHPFDPMVIHFGCGCRTLGLHPDKEKSNELIHMEIRETNVIWLPTVHFLNYCYKNVQIPAPGTRSPSSKLRI
ncbi:hypothetical protein CEXT_38871 [Caerostris extrusa]|uniref:Uncharacterized protein n=1 Tax=Caerostris extrusa TaxID=172846 RepID=A0AAV4P4X2_CAEEX|nr:hypothetical protein CEXT_38871 [Caerostris extrusa]